LKGKYVIKKAVEYVNFDGETVTEVLYFHLNKLEIVNHKDTFFGLQKRFEELLVTKDVFALIPLLDELLAMAYGQRDGDIFVKPPEKTAAFLQSDAHAELVLGLISSIEDLGEFFTGLVPSGMQAEMAEQLRGLNVKPESLSLDPSSTAGDVEAVPEKPEEAPKKFEDYTHAELLEMPQHQFDNLLAPAHQRSRGQLVVAMQRATKS
jgi:hypothetical protein